MNGNSLNFNNKNIEKNYFYNKNKNIFNIDDIDVKRILFSKKEQYGKHNSFKYFIGYNDNNVVRPLYLFLSQTTGYINKFEENKITMALMVEGKQLLENYKKIWKKIKRLMGLDFENQATYNDKYINTKIKIYKHSITTNFCDKTGSKEVPKEKIPHKCLSIIILDSALYGYENYYPQTFLEECKYVKKNVKTKNYIDEELKSEYDTNSDVDIE